MRFLQLAKNAIRLKPEEKPMYAEKVMDFGNIAAGALIFGQSVSGKFIFNEVVILGFIVWLGCIGCAKFILRR